ncbi:hypothetical protein BKK54_05040 [Rodentibacter genomosp. 1]|uniref:Uncharacterized protein n=1 Tax=Rodentibacter genomosp. 1 TaxID=1908264 RepID=A0A1V3J5F9_9PAST|nr:hypothetical protein [Rodentibacter genomosp. 1]OOF50453.1 hypothetical protein BKK54_05040 [Rodentibacter genomosp. 1]
MIYQIEYTYPQQEAIGAIGSFHFVEAVSEKIAMYKAQAFIAEQLYYYFDQDVDFEIKSIELVK